MADFLDGKDFEKMATMMKVVIVKGSVAPRYDEEKVGQVGVEKVVITEKGMKSGLPLVDLQLVDKNGDKLFLVLSGRVLKGICSVLDGINQRNHGTTTP